MSFHAAILPNVTRKYKAGFALDLLKCSFHHQILSAMPSIAKNAFQQDFTAESLADPADFARHIILFSFF